MQQPSRTLTTDIDVRYQAAVNLVNTIDYQLQRGTHHYRDRRGRLLMSLDEAVRAILKDDLVLPR